MSNPHIPAFVSQAPWYLANDNGGRMDHQKKPVEEEPIDPVEKMRARYKRSTGPVAKKYRKGACENCGAMSHKTKDCLERPRKRGARWTSENIAPDEIVIDTHAETSKATDWDSKRDRWDGFDPEIHEDHMRILEKKQQDVEDKKKNKPRPNVDDSDYDSDFDSDADEAAHAQYGGNANLRVREDVAKYLLNLDPNSAHYDPKTRSMRDDPGTVPGVYSGDKFVLKTGDASSMKQLELFAWQSEQRGEALQINANPTEAHLKHKEYLAEFERSKREHQALIKDKYGATQTLPPELLHHARAPAQTAPETKSLPGNHRSVYGSYFSVKDRKWGYSCCKKLDKAAPCDQD